MQTFKGDATELKMIESGTPPFDACSASLDQFFEGCYNDATFLLKLYDEGRMPFADRVPRDSFVAFINQAIPKFPRTGTFEAYIFIINAIFGDGSGVEFTLPPGEEGTVQILVNASNAISWNWQSRERVGASLESFDMVTDDGDTLQFHGIAGIDTEDELRQLLLEIIPAGINAEITLDFFTISFFVDDVGDSIVTDEGDPIIFFEL